MSDPFAALTSLRAAYDIAKTMNGMMTESKVNEVRLALQEALLDAQEKLRDGRDELEEQRKEITFLKGEIERLKDWSSERETYELTRINFNGVFVYIPKGFMGRYENALKLCPNCFGKGNKTILQDAFPGPPPGRRHYLVCQSGCPSITFDRYLEPPTPTIQAGGN